MITTNALNVKAEAQKMRGPALTSNMPKAKYKYDGLDPMTDTPRPARLAEGAILTQANRQELLDSRPEVKAARIAALKAAKARKGGRKKKAE